MLNRYVGWPCRLLDGEVGLLSIENFVWTTIGRIDSSSRVFNFEDEWVGLKILGDDSGKSVSMQVGFGGSESGHVGHVLANQIECRFGDELRIDRILEEVVGQQEIRTEHDLRWRVQAIFSNDVIPDQVDDWDAFRPVRVSESTE